MTPDRVTGVVVSAGPALDGPPVQDVDELVAEADELATRFASATRRRLLAQVPPHEDFFRPTIPRRRAFLGNLRRALTSPDGTSRQPLLAGEWDVSLADISVPVDLVYGDADQMVVLDNGRRLAAAIPHARLHVIPGAGHGFATFGSADLVLSILADGRT